MNRTQAGRAESERPGDSRRATEIAIPGRILFLTEDPELIRRQLAGEDLPLSPGPLLDNISTDEITPAWVCFWYDETLGRYALVGLRNGAIEPDAVKSGGFGVVVSGRSKGCGSSRETAPYAEKAAGIRLVLAASFEKIYAQNCHNIGLYTSTDFGLLARLRRAEPIPLRELTSGLDPTTCAVVERGGLFAYNRARLEGAVAMPLSRRAARPMTAVEKIIARHVVADLARDTMGAAAVAPGDAVFCRADVRFSHDYVTAMAAAQFHEGFGDAARVSEPESVYAFRDHLTFLDRIMPAAKQKMGLLALAADMADRQREFCATQGIRLFGECADGGSEAICHNAVLEEIALPGQLVVGTDSHTCTAGALGCLAFGVGSTDMANAWRTRDVRVQVPASVRIELTGRLRPGRSAKDIMLHLMTDAYLREGRALGRVLEFAGDGLAELAIDERATLANMAVEAGAMTAFLPADDATFAYLAAERPGLDSSRARAAAVHADPDAEYAHRLHLPLDRVPVMVATPGDPRHGVPLAALGEVRIDIAYGGSCTGGKRADMDAYASVLARAAAHGRRVAPGVRFYIQFGSQRVRRYAAERGYLELFARVGAELLAPSCGACINAGPGASTSPEQISVSAINRNFPGRSGPGKVYLASPQVVAASALAGRIIDPEFVLSSLGG